MVSIYLRQGKVGEIGLVGMCDGEQIYDFLCETAMSYQFQSHPPKKGSELKISYEINEN
jgi:hypothetical protein